MPFLSWLDPDNVQYLVILLLNGLGGFVDVAHDQLGRPPAQVVGQGPGVDLMNQFRPEFTHRKMGSSKMYEDSGCLLLTANKCWSLVQNFLSIIRL
jgi:hypothetical protein